MSSVDTMGTTSAASGYVTPTGPLTTTTWCPASTAAAANAAPMRPLDALLRYRTGSRYCRVGPEVMRMRDISERG